IRKRKHLLSDFFHGLLFVAILSKFDEVGILGKPAGIQVERYAVSRTDFLYRANVGHRYRLSASRITGHRQYDQRYAPRTHSCDQSFEGVDVHISLERVKQRRLVEFRNREIHCVRTNVFDVGASSIEMGVVWNDLIGFRQYGK